jgi:CRP-like cAMP-binding protein
LVTNRFLKALPEASLKRLLPHLESVELARGERLYARGAAAEFVYFVERGLVSMLLTMGDGRKVEVSVAGADGLVGLAGLLAASETLLEAIVRIPGRALRIRAERLRAEAERDRPVADTTRQYVALSLAHSAQIAACNRLHNLDQRVCRWLLAAYDSVQGHVIPVTHEQLAVMLGVQRPGVTVVARTLRNAGLIDYSVGKVTVLDRARLEARSCECYAAMRGHHL